MNRLGITEGEWIVYGVNPLNEWFQGDINCNNADLSIVFGDTKKEAEANAKLIADAGTTANKCGLLPSELLDQRDELLEALQKMCEYHEKMATWDKGDNGYYSAKKLIQKIETTKWKKK